MSRPLVAITGATGFIGSAVLAEVRRRGAAVRHIGRRPAAGPRHADYQWFPADLEQPETLRGACGGATALVHLASYIGPDPGRCQRVNEEGGDALAAEAARCLVPRLVHLSTAAVYGRGPHQGIDVDEVPPEPVSPASRSRLAGEAAFRRAGATVLRPGLVLGPGDCWVVPALAELAARVPARWDGGDHRLSVVAVHDLARLIAEVALRDGALPGVHHASHPTALRTGELMDALAGHGLVPPLREDWDWDTCVRRLHSSSGEVSERQFHLLAQDHWYRSDRIWAAARCPSGPHPLRRIAESASWYRAHLADRADRAPA